MTTGTWYGDEERSTSDEAGNLAIRRLITCFWLGRNEAIEKAEAPCFQGLPL